MDRKLIIATGGTAVVSLAAGGISGFFIAKRRLEAQYSELVAREIADAKRFYQRLYKQDEFSTAASAVNELTPDEEVDVIERAIDSLKVYQGRTESSDVEVVEQPDDNKDESDDGYNIFRDGTENPYDFREVRDTDRPYIIDEEEFLENEPEHDQVSLTYFAEDDVLLGATGTRGEVINDKDAIVGEENLTRFGVGTTNKHLLYVRNEKLEQDYEITCSDGKYSREVLGFIEHSDGPPRVRRFRRED